jgi:hypothetical protein
MNNPNLTEDWPNEPDKHEVEAFARHLAASIPQLPAPALDRVQARMEEAIVREHSQRRQRKWALASAVAASLLIGVTYFIASLFPSVGKAPRPEIVRDVYRVPAIDAPAPAPPEQPLIALEAHQGLFTN